MRLAMKFVVVGLLILAAAICGGHGRAIPLLLPHESQTRLAIQKEGMDILRNINTKLTVVTVIGPYRSGKSFLLNQLLGLGCEEGFGVGHNREAQTKGVWLWTPQVENQGGETLSVVYVDTEGFEGTGKSDVYDDRVFAFATMASSVLIYNLPETVKEADIEKLSFAVELAEEFSARVGEDEGEPSDFQLPTLLWLIQRDFLEGRTVEKMVADALEPVANPDGDEDIAHLNEIRTSLQALSHGGTVQALGLPQPHLQRTKLCDLRDEELEPAYLRARDDLRQRVTSLYTPRMRRGRPMTGADFADFITRTVNALNENEIPSARSITDAFNKDVMRRYIDTYTARIERVPLPKDGDVLENIHFQYFSEAIEEYKKARFGRRDDDVADMREQLKKIYGYRLDANAKASMETCEALYLDCEGMVERLAAMRLPSLGKFEADFAACNATYKESCVGPSKHAYQGRIQALYGREKARFVKEFNDRLFQGLSIGSLVAIPVMRFVVQSGFLEGVAWLLFLLLEVAPKLAFLDSNFYESKYWVAFAVVYEKVVFNDYYDLNAQWPWMLSLGAVVACWHRFLRRYDACSAASLCARLSVCLPVHRLRGVAGWGRREKDADLKV